MKIYKEKRKVDFLYEIINLYKDNPNQCSLKEYEFIKNILVEKSPCNFLVFGCGKDSKIWNNINNDGKTIFLENNENWINKVRKDLGNIDIRKINYNTKLKDWKELIDDCDKLKVFIEDDIKNKYWDLIFIDAPCGCNDNDIGRMQSIFTASLLDCNNYILHDCNRNVEDFYGNKYLGKKLIQIDKLRYYEGEFNE